MADEFSTDEQERIKEHIRARGMAFEVFLPQELANWLREKIAAGAFANPGEAAFIAFQELRDLDRHPAARIALLTERLRSSIEDPRPNIAAEDLRAQIHAQMREYADREKPADD